MLCGEDRVGQKATAAALLLRDDQPWKREPGTQTDHLEDLPPASHGILVLSGALSQQEESSELTFYTFFNLWG